MMNPFRKRFVSFEFQGKVMDVRRAIASRMSPITRKDFLTDGLIGELRGDSLYVYRYRVAADIGRAPGKVAYRATISCQDGKTIVSGYFQLTAMGRIFYALLLTVAPLILAAAAIKFSIFQGGDGNSIEKVLVVVIISLATIFSVRRDLQRIEEDIEHISSQIRSASQAIAHE